jgi:hypothetical protein
VLLPAGYDPALRAGRAAQVTLVVDQTRPAPTPARSAVAAAVARQAAVVRAAQFTAGTAGAGFDAALGRAKALAAEQDRVRVRATTLGGQEDDLPSGFEYTTPSNLSCKVWSTTNVCSALTRGTSSCRPGCRRSGRRTRSARRRR